MENTIKQQFTEEINHILKERLSEASQTYSKIKEAFETSYDWPEIDILKYEVCVCIIFSLNQAAITMTNHMLESFLKYALGYKQSIQDERFKETVGDINALTDILSTLFEIDDGKTLNDTINKSCTLGIITKEDKKILHKYRESIRNAYSHAEKRKIHENKEIPVQLAKINDLTGIQVQQESIQKILHMPFIHGLAQLEHAKANAIPYFLYIDKLVRKSKHKIFSQNCG